VSFIRTGLREIGLKIRRYRGAKPTSYLRSYLRFFTAASATAARLAFHKPYDVVIVCTMPDAAGAGRTLGSAAVAAANGSVLQISMKTPPRAVEPVIAATAKYTRGRGCIAAKNFTVTSPFRRAGI